VPIEEEEELYIYVPPVSTACSTVTYTFSFPQSLIRCRRSFGLHCKICFDIVSPVTLFNKFWCRIHLWFRLMGGSADKVDDFTA